MNIIGYCRVSTDEQADNGFSLSHQEETINKYCRENDHRIIKIFKEDFSGFKTFKRPSWIQLETFVKEASKTTKIDAVICTRWDRFSRNESEASTKIKEFRKKEIKVIMIEAYYDPSDLSGPMLNSIHMHLAEMESKKNSIRTKEGMRRGMREGYWMYRPPFGYNVSKALNNKPVLVPVPEKAKFINLVYEQMATGLHSAESLRKKYYKELDGMSKQNFLYTLRRVVYTGMIELKETESEKREIVKGLHEAIISKDLFQKVQDVLDGKKPSQKKVNNQVELYPLKNFLKCADHSRTFTASGSRGRNGIHHYYHCTCSKCKNRFGVNKMEEFIYGNLRGLIFPSEILQLANMVFEDVYEASNKSSKSRLSQIEKELETINEKRIRIQDNYMDGDLDPKTMSSLMERLETQEIFLKREVDQIKSQKVPINSLLQKSQLMLQELPEIFLKSSGESKQLICGSMFSGKIEFSNKEVRTVPWKSFVSKIMLINRELEDLKTKKADKNVGLHSLAPPLGLEPRTP
jgi:site-specific DNA recombinase